MAFEAVKITLIELLGRWGDSTVARPAKQIVLVDRDRSLALLCWHALSDLRIESRRKSKISLYLGKHFGCLMKLWCLTLDPSLIPLFSSTVHRNSIPSSRLPRTLDVNGDSR